MANKIRIKADHEMRMNWAGVFPHITEDSDVFNRMPSSRQAEIRFNHELVYNNPHAFSFLIYDPKTGRPEPNQTLLSDIAKKVQDVKSTLPEVPLGFKFITPNGIPRGLFTNFPEPTEDQAFQILVAFEQHATRERVIEYCSYNKRLLAEKPVDGIFAFIWRFARYMSGVDIHVPSTVFIDLVDGCSKLTHFRVDLKQVKPITKLLQDRAEELVHAIGGDKYIGALRWARAVGVDR